LPSAGVNQRSDSLTDSTAEDLAGIIIVLAIAVSAGAVGWESAKSLTDPHCSSSPPG
jgi:divalent metal cation (Fe/Co/Zn/Cd) transporter